MKYISAAILLICIQHSSFSQNSEFNTLANKMLFNVLIYEVDSSTHVFLKKYVPPLAVRSQRGGWSSERSNAVLKQQSSIHNLVFKQHPFFDFKFEEGQLSFRIIETEGEGTAVQDICIFFTFQSKFDADSVFGKLVHLFKPVSTKHDVVEKNSKQIALFTDSRSTFYFNTVHFILTKDELLQDKFKIFFWLSNVEQPKLNIKLSN